MTQLNVQHTKVTPESKAKPLPHPPVGRGIPNGSTAKTIMKESPFKTDVKEVNSTKAKALPWEK